MEKEFNLLQDFSWLTRRMLSPVSSVNIIDEFFYVGDIDGNMYVWNLDGDLYWCTDSGDRVENIAIAKQHDPALLFATVGVDIICLEAETGKLLWSQKLEGSSDEIVCNPTASVIVATSSVFDVEHLDFMESACWKFDAKGELLNVSRFDERPWYVGLLESNEVIMGLGRPSCGAKLFLENKDFVDIEVTNSSPVTCGSGRGKDTILGHANGGITCILDSKEVYSSENEDQSTTSVLASTEKLLLQVQESGKITYFHKNGEAWNFNLNQNIERGVIGFIYQNKNTIWLTSHDATSSKIYVLDSTDATQICSFSISSRIRAISSDERFVIIGLEDGNVHVIESEQFSRRLSSSNKKEEEGSTYRREMLEKLRNLNKE